MRECQQIYEKLMFTSKYVLYELVLTVLVKRAPDPHKDTPLIIISQNPFGVTITSNFQSLFLEN